MEEVHQEDAGVVEHVLAVEADQTTSKDAEVDVGVVVEDVHVEEVHVEVEVEVAVETGSIAIATRKIPIFL